MSERLTLGSLFDGSGGFPLGGLLAGIEPVWASEIECGRLQGFPDDWCSRLETENPSDGEIDFWEEVFETHRRIVSHAKKPKTRKQIIRWLRYPHSDSAEFRLWGNGGRSAVRLFRNGRNRESKRRITSGLLKSFLDRRYWVMEKLNLSAPWHTYHRKIRALFEGDPAIVVGEVYPAANGRDYAFDVMVDDHRKYLALDRVLNRLKLFGSVALTVNLLDTESGEGDDAIELYRTIFEGNPIVRDVREVIDAAGVRHGYVRFQPDVIQFFNDDLSDFDRNWSGLASDIAREAFDDVAHGVFFCTASLRENDG